VGQAIAKDVAEPEKSQAPRKQMQIAFVVVGLASVLAAGAVAGSNLYTLSLLLQ
jgi:hypothetical protein